jgi:hypothetical protein
LLQTIKNKIKSNNYTKQLYAKSQCALVLTQYFIIRQLYRFTSAPNIKHKYTSILQDKKPYIFYFGTDELQDKSGFLQALEIYANVTYFTKENGDYGSYNFGATNRKKNIENNKKQLMKLLSQMKMIPDILLMQSWEWRIGLETLEEIKKLYPSMKIVNIAMDDRHSFWLYGSKKYGSAGLIPALECVFTTSSEAVEWYQKEGCQAFFYPLASDEDIFKPLALEKVYEVGFVGAKYGIRETIVNALIARGINVQAYGNGWESGRLPIDETNLFYNQCKIVLGVGTILGCNHFTSMKLRDFDVPMSGSVYITNYHEDTAKIFVENKEILFYKDANDCVSKIEKVLLDEMMIQSIGKDAREKALQHTYKIRIQTMLRELGYQS